MQAAQAARQVEAQQAPTDAGMGGGGAVARTPGSSSCGVHQICACYAQGWVLGGSWRTLHRGSCSTRVRQKGCRGVRPTCACCAPACCPGTRLGQSCSAAGQPPAAGAAPPRAPGRACRHTVTRTGVWGYGLAHLGVHGNAHTHLCGAMCTPSPRECMHTHAHTHLCGAMCTPCPQECMHTHAHTKKHTHLYGAMSTSCPWECMQTHTRMDIGMHTSSSPALRSTHGDTRTCTAAGTWANEHVSMHAHIHARAHTQTWTHIHTRTSVCTLSCVLELPHTSAHIPPLPSFRKKASTHPSTPCMSLSSCTCSPPGGASPPAAPAAGPPHTATAGSPGPRHAPSPAPPAWQGARPGQRDEGGDGAHESHEQVVVCRCVCACVCKGVQTRACNSAEGPLR